jgi:hypothetical protein
VTYLLREFRDEFTNAPSNPTPTFKALVRFKRDYAKLTPPQRRLFRAAVEKFVAPLSTTPPGQPGEPPVRELEQPRWRWLRGQRRSQRHAGGEQLRDRAGVVESAVHLDQSPHDLVGERAARELPRARPGWRGRPRSRSPRGRLLARCPATRAPTGSPRMKSGAWRHARNAAARANGSPSTPSAVESSTNNPRAAARMAAATASRPRALSVGSPAPSRG